MQHLPKCLPPPYLHHNQHHQEDDGYIARWHVAEHDQAHAIGNVHDENKTSNHTHQTTHATETGHIG